MLDIKSLIRPNILELVNQKQHNAAADDKTIAVRLDANENPFNAPHNHYSDQSKEELKIALGNIKHIWPHCIALCNGTDEAIDFIFRIFCVPGEDNILAVAPTSRQYETYALLNGVTYRPIALNPHFQLLADEVLTQCDTHTKVIFLCSPNNPTGNLLDYDQMELICKRFEGIVVVDEAYHEFSRKETMIRSISKYHNLVVLNTLSKAYASADLRLSIVYAIPEIIAYIKAILPHHHINQWTLEQSLDILKRKYDVEKWINQLLEERRKVMAAIKSLPCCVAIYPSDANFFLVKFKDAASVDQFLRDRGIAVCNCSNMPGCENCLRITVGLPSENNTLIGALRQY